MFTGIVEELGRVRAFTPNAGGARIEIDATDVLDDATIGASIAVNGCCLTVVELGDGHWAADAVVETLARTNLGALAPGDPVNLERPVRLADRLGGHLVQGHVDATGTVRAARAATRRLRALPVRGARRSAALRRAEGLDHRRRHQPHRRGGLATTRFSVALIPHTLAVTTLGARAAGARVNLEVDVIAKYVERLLVSDRSPT